MDTMQWVSVVLGMLGLCLTIFAGIGAVFSILLGFIIRRLIKTIDVLVASMDSMKLALAKRPIYEAVKEISEEVADHRVTVHEKDNH